MHEAGRYARSHIQGCLLCAGKGFICEVCKHSEPIYPFDLNSIIQCEKCFSVFHPDCSSKLNNCPKCDRIEARNLKWHVTMSLTERSKSPTDISTTALAVSSHQHFTMTSNKAFYTMINAVLHYTTPTHALDSKLEGGCLGRIRRYIIFV